MATRNLTIEKKMVDTFNQQRGRLPSSSADWAEVHKMAYPTVDTLPDEFKKTEAANYYSGPTNPVTPNPVPTVPALPQNDTNIAGLKSDVAAAKIGVNELSSPNSALNVLQEAIKTKTNTTAAPIGESEIFKQAGVGGFGALSQSLQARGVELATNAAEFRNTIDKMGGQYKDRAQSAQFAYQSAVDAYNAEVGRVQKIMDDLRNNEQQIKLLNIQHNFAKDLEAFKSTVPSISEQIDIEKSGLELSNGRVTDPSKGIVEGFNIGRYATDPNHERAVASIVQGIGKFNTLQDVESYITRKYPNSPITGDMISKASEKYGVPWEMLVAMMEQDSSLGTAGKGARTFNPGNVGNDDAGNIRNYGNWQSGVNAVAQWLDKNRVTKKVKDEGKFTPQFYSTTEGQKVRDDERALQGTFLSNQNVKDFQAVQSQYQNMNKVLTAGVGGPGDLDMVYSFMKGLDPNSVVRETEFATAAKSGNIFAGAFAKYNGYLKENGGFLPENVKSAFLKLVEMKLDTKKEEVDNFKKQIEDQAARQGLNPKNVTIDFTIQKPQKIEVVAPNGKTYSFDSQNQVNAWKSRVKIK